MSTPIPCPSCQSPPTVEHGPRGYRVTCPNRNRVAGRPRSEAVAGGACPTVAPTHWRKSERAAIKTWNGQGETVEDGASRVSVEDGPWCVLCKLLEPHECL